MSSLSPAAAHGIHAAQPIAQPKSAAAIYLESNGTDAPDALCCPISKDLLEDPVITAAGGTYERRAIEKWLQSQTTDPQSRAHIAGTTLIPNYAMRSMAEAFMDDVRSEAARLGVAPPPLTAKDRARITLQRYARGYLVRKPRVMARQAREDQAAGVIQKHVRGYLARQAFVAFQGAATQIQKNVRGHLVRQALRRDAMEQLAKGNRKPAVTLAELGTLSLTTLLATPRGVRKPNSVAVEDLAAPTTQCVSASGGLGQLCPTASNQFTIWYTKPSLSAEGELNLGLHVSQAEDTDLIFNERRYTSGSSQRQLLANAPVAVLGYPEQSKSFAFAARPYRDALSCIKSMRGHPVPTHTGRAAVIRNDAVFSFVTDTRQWTSTFANPDSVRVFDSDAQLSLTLETSSSASGAERHALTHWQAQANSTRFFTQPPQQAWILDGGAVATAFHDGSVEIYAANLQRRLHRFSVPVPLTQHNAVGLHNGLLVHTASGASIIDSQTGRTVSSVDTAQALPDGQLLDKHRPQWTVVGPHVCGISSTGLLWVWNAARDTFLRGGFGAKFLAGVGDCELLVNYENKQVLKHTLV